MEQERFLCAKKAAEMDMGGKGIGTMHEKSIHIVLKYYFAPDPACHEQTVGGYIADAVTEDGVVEIQTRALGRLRKKLTAFLAACPVTVVYPIAETKWLCTVDENGAIVSKRKSPKHETVMHGMREIYGLREMVGLEGFRICVVRLETEEYRIRSNQPRRKFHGIYEKLDRMPKTLLGLTMLETPMDYLSLLETQPKGEFTVRMLAQENHAAEGDIRMLLKLLERLGAVRQTGKKGNAVTWEIAPPFRTDCNSAS